MWKNANARCNLSWIPFQIEFVTHFHPFFWQDEEKEEENHCFPLEMPEHLTSLFASEDLQEALRNSRKDLAWDPPDPQKPDVSHWKRAWQLWGPLAPAAAGTQAAKGRWNVFRSANSAECLESNSRKSSGNEDILQAQNHQPNCLRKDY